VLLRHQLPEQARVDRFVDQDVHALARRDERVAGLVSPTAHRAAGVVHAIAERGLHAPMRHGEAVTVTPFFLVDLSTRMSWAITRMPSGEKLSST